MHPGIGFHRVYSLCCALFLLSASGVPARVLDVPDDFSVLQTALDSARANDTVRVTGGVYAPVALRGKDSITLLGDRWPRITRGGITTDIPALSLRKCSGWTISGFETDSTYEGVTIDSCRDMLIERNRCSRHDERASFHGVGIKVTNSSGIAIRRNVVTGNEYIGLVAGGTRIAIMNNTIGKTAGYEAIMVSGATTDSVDIVNNILFSTGKNSLEYGYGAAQKTGQVRYNIVWDAGEEPYCSNCTLDSTNIEADPLFVDADHDDFHLTPGSPAVNRGDTALTDPDGSRSDIGAYRIDETAAAPRRAARTAAARLTAEATARGICVWLPEGCSRHSASLAVLDIRGRRLPVRSLSHSVHNALFIPREALAALGHGMYYIRVSGDNIPPVETLLPFCPQ